MKKRIVFISCLVLMLAGACLLAYITGISWKTSLVPKEFPAYVPSSPLVYVQCSHLQSYLPRLQASAAYQDFLQSPLMQDIQKSEWWQELLVAGEETMRAIHLDPMRIIGRELAVALYPPDEFRTLPNLLAFIKIDRVVRSAERMVYLFDQVAGSIGIRFQEDMQGFSVYRIERSDLLLPIYYAIIDDVGMIATSRTLLQTAIQQATRQDEQTGRLSPFQQVVHTLPQHQVLTGYVHPAGVLNTLQLQHSSPSSNWPFVTWQLQVEADRTVLGIELFPADRLKNAGKPQQVPLTAARRAHTFPYQTEAQEFPLIGEWYPSHAPAFLHTLEQLFPQAIEWGWGDDIFQGSIELGETIECRLSERLVGTLYTLPDIVCVGDGQNPHRARAFLEAARQAVLAQLIPSSTQRNMLISQVEERYRDISLSKTRAMFQEMFCYTVMESNTESMPPASIFSTNTPTVKRTVDTLFETGNIALAFQRQTTPHTDVHPRQPITAWRIHPVRLAQWLDALVSSQTFSTLLVPRRRFPLFYEALPVILRGLQSCPPVWIEAGNEEHRAYLDLTIR